jgi:predicted enzyme related to lactoylglutathione lyase
MSGVNRVVIVVKDLERAGRLFSELLGTTFYDADAATVNMYKVKAKVSWDGGLEIVEPITDDTEAARFLKEKGEGLWGVFFNVDDADKAIAKVKEMGLRQTGTVEFDRHPLFNKFKEILLAPDDTCGTFVALIHTEKK